MFLSVQFVPTDNAAKGKRLESATGVRGCLAGLIAQPLESLSQLGVLALLFAAVVVTLILLKFGAQEDGGESETVSNLARATITLS